MSFLRLLKWFRKSSGKKDVPEKKTEERSRRFVSIEDISTGPKSLKDKVRSVGIIALCQEGESGATFFVHDLRLAEDVKSVESAREVLEKVLSSPFKDRVYNQLPELPNGTTIISKVWVTHFFGYMFLGGEKDAVDNMHTSGIEECLGFPKIEVIVERVDE